MKYFAPLSLKECLYLFGIYILCFVWLMADQLFLPSTSLRFVVLTIILLSLFYLLYNITKPDKLFSFINSVVLVTLLFTILLSLIMHLMINNDFNYKILIIWAIVTLFPYLAGFIYMKKEKK